MLNTSVIFEKKYWKRFIHVTSTFKNQWVFNGFFWKVVNVLSKINTFAARWSLNHWIWQRSGWQDPDVRDDRILRASMVDRLAWSMRYQAKKKKGELRSFAQNGTRPAKRLKMQTEDHWRSQRQWRIARRRGGQKILSLWVDCTIAKPSGAWINFWSWNIRTYCGWCDRSEWLWRLGFGTCMHRLWRRSVEVTW